MSRIIRVIIQNSLHQNKNRDEVENREIRYVPDISILNLLSVYILGKSKHLIVFFGTYIAAGGCATRIRRCRNEVLICGEKMLRLIFSPTTGNFFGYEDTVRGYYSFIQYQSTLQEILIPYIYI